MYIYKRNSTSPHAPMYKSFRKAWSLSAPLFSSSPSCSYATQPVLSLQAPSPTAWHVRMPSPEPYALLSCLCPEGAGLCTECHPMPPASPTACSGASQTSAPPRYGTSTERVSTPSAVGAPHTCSRAEANAYFRSSLAPADHP